MNELKRLSVRFAGESGHGINSMGEILNIAFKRSGYNVFGYREYPSIIKGGYSFYQNDVSDKTVNSPSQGYDVMFNTSRESIYQYLPDIRENGIIIHSQQHLFFNSKQKEEIKNKNVTVKFIDAIQIANENGGEDIMSNIVYLGILWKLLKLNKEVLEDVIKNEFKHKPKFIEPNIRCLNAGYNLDTDLNNIILDIEQKEVKDNLIITGNEALALGAISSGVRAVFGYPMTPATSILDYLADTSDKTGILFKQAEDEITAVQMCMGAMFAGTRALTATSGGGFDLMTETISLSGITEVPLVVTIAQRPGPATGLPTWTSNGDLNVALYGGHGEFPRCVLSVSDVKDAYGFIQSAYNIAEEYQIPVILLTDKLIAESHYSIDQLPDPINIKRGLVSNDEITKKNISHRYNITENGVSNRWIPAESHITYNSNSDEHIEDGSVTEDAYKAKEMLDKRACKMKALRKIIPEPDTYGKEDAPLSFVGWGSTKNTILDLIELGYYINYLHYSFIYPLKTKVLIDFVSRSKEIILIENNQAAQLGNLIRSKTGIEIKQKLLKYNGRPFFIEEIKELVQDILNNR